MAKNYKKNLAKFDFERSQHCCHSSYESMLFENLLLNKHCTNYKLENKRRGVATLGLLIPSQNSKSK